MMWAVAFLHLMLLGTIVCWLMRRCKQKSACVKPSASAATSGIELPDVRVAAPRADAEPATEAAGPVVDAEAATLAAEPAQPDNLQIIEGIGPKISAILGAAGIITFAQLAATDVSRLREVLQTAGIRLSDPTTWPEQAGLAAEGRWDDLKALQASLKGGRKAS
jgi:large subunit ribosomal protein L20